VISRVAATSNGPAGERMMRAIAACRVRATPIGGVARTRQAAIARIIRSPAGPLEVAATREITR